MKIRLYFSKLLLCLLSLTRMTLQLFCSATIKLQLNAILPKGPMIVERKVIQVIKGGKKSNKKERYKKSITRSCQFFSRCFLFNTCMELKHLLS